MKQLHRNMKPFYYANYVSKTDYKDGDAYSGEYEINYTNPQIAYGNISASSGSTINRATANVHQRQFGETVDYDRVIVCQDFDLPIAESTVIWIDPPVTPELDAVTGDFNTPYTYIVTRVARTLNVLSLTLREVTVS